MAYITCDNINEKPLLYKPKQEDVKYHLFNSYVNERIIITNNDSDKIKIHEICNNFSIWYTSNSQGGKRIKYKSAELKSFMNNKFGLCKPFWRGVKILYDNTLDIDLDEEL